MFTILDEIKPFDTKVVTIDAWYDRHTRDWVIELLNKDGYQVGDCIRCPDKATKNAEVAWLKKQYNI